MDLMSLLVFLMKQKQRQQQMPGPQRNSNYGMWGHSFDDPNGWSPGPTNPFQSGPQITPPQVDTGKLTPEQDWTTWTTPSYNTPSTTKKTFAPKPTGWGDMSQAPTSAFGNNGMASSWGQGSSAWGGKSPFKWKI